MTRYSCHRVQVSDVAVLLAAVVLAATAATGTAAAAPSGRGSRHSVAVPASAPPPPPTGFDANSITWLSPSEGWIMGAASCATGTCTEVMRTTDGAKTWNMVGTIPAPIPTAPNYGSSGVTEIRFATAEVGFAFTPDLYRTTNGGQTWTLMTIPGKGAQVTAVAANSSRAYAVVSKCAYKTGLCRKQFAFWRSDSLTSSKWSLVMDLPSVLSTDIATYGPSVYVIASTAIVTPTPDSFYASTDGLHFSARPDPCDTSHLVALTQAVPTSGTDVTLLCVGPAQQLAAVKAVYRSTDTGEHDVSLGSPGINGNDGDLAVSPSGEMAVASVSADSLMYVNDKGGTTWTCSVNKSDGGLGFNDVVYRNDHQVWVVYAPAQNFVSVGQVWESPDNGRHWVVVSV
jgi:hypothetical protein